MKEISSPRMIQSHGCEKNMANVFNYLLELFVNVDL